MVYPCGPISYERHPIVIFEEWEAMGIFDDTFDSDPSINGPSTSSRLSSPNSIISFISTTPDEVVVQEYNHSLSTVSAISSPPTSGATFNIASVDPPPPMLKSDPKVHVPSPSQNDEGKGLESASFTKAEENKKEEAPPTSKKQTEATPGPKANTTNKDKKKQRVSYVSKAA